MVDIETHNLAVRIYDALNKKGDGQLPDAFTAIKVIEKELSAQQSVQRTFAEGCPGCGHKVGEGHAADCRLAHPQSR